VIEMATNLAPVPSESTNCANCGAAIVSDQRYCLACGHPVSPVRLAFLDVLQSDREAPGATLAAARLAYGPPLEPAAGPAWVRRYAPLFAVLAVLLLAMIAGLLIGHWVTQNKSPGQQVVKVEGLSAAPAAAATTTSTTPSASAAHSSAAASAQTKKEEAEEAKEAAAEKSKPLEKAVKISPAKVQKLTTSTGKKHQEEVSALGNAPIETGGGGGSSTPAPSSESNKPIGGGSAATSIE
jgi:hypothetical protein